MVRIIRTAVCLLTLLLAGQSSGLWAAESVDRLLRLVGDDVGLCVQLENLREQRTALAGSELFARLQRTAAYPKWHGSRDFQKLLDARTVVEQLAGQPVGTLFDETFGQAVVLAVYPDADRKPIGVLLTQAANPESLQAVLATWNRLDPQQLESHDYSRTEYFSRTKPARGKRPAETLFYVTIGDVLAVSDTSEAIREVIDLAAAGPPVGRAKSVLESAAFRATRAMLAAGTENSVYLNPRAWDAVLRIETIAQSADAGARAFARLWQRFEALALGVRLQEGIVAELIVRYDGAGLPPTWRRFVEQTAPPRDIWERTPGDALLAFAGPNDLALLGSALAAWAPPGKNRDWDRLRQVARGLLLGRDLFDDVLPKLESCGAYVVARPNREAPGQPPPGLPLEALAVFTLPSSTATADDPSAVPDLRASLENALNTGLNVLAAAQNAKGSETVAAVRTSEREGLRLRWIEGAGPHQPAYGLTATHLILASSPQLIRDFEQPPRAPSPSYEHVAQQYFAGENQVLFVNLARISQFLGDQRESLTRQTAASHGVSEPEAAQRLQRINELLQLLDAGFIAGHLHEDSLRIVVGGVVVPPAAR